MKKVIAKIIKVLPQSQRHGFTLVELLVVISIIALLLAILMPALGKVRKVAQTVVCGSNCKQLGIAFSLYTTEHQYLPAAREFIYGDPTYAWYSLIFPYVAKKFKTDVTSECELYICPATKSIRGPFENTGISPGFGTGLERITYGVNYGGYEGIFNIEVRAEDRNRPKISSLPPDKRKAALSSRSMKLSQIKRPSEIFAMMDAQLLKRTSNNEYKCHPWVFAPYTPKSTEDDQVSQWPFDRDYDGDGVLDSHSANLNLTGTRYEEPGGAYMFADPERHDGLNALFVDGHVSKVKKLEWVEKNHWTW